MTILSWWSYNQSRPKNKLRVLASRCASSQTFANFSSVMSVNKWCRQGLTIARCAGFATYELIITVSGLETVSPFKTTNSSCSTYSIKLWLSLIALLCFCTDAKPLTLGFLIWCSKTLPGWSLCYYRLHFQSDLESFFQSVWAWLHGTERWWSLASVSRETTMSSQHCLPT